MSGLFKMAYPLYTYNIVEGIPSDIVKEGAERLDEKSRLVILRISQKLIRFVEMTLITNNKIVQLSSSSAI